MNKNWIWPTGRGKNIFAESKTYWKIHKIMIGNITHWCPVHGSWSSQNIQKVFRVAHINQPSTNNLCEKMVKATLVNDGHPPPLTIFFLIIKNQFSRVTVPPCFDGKKNTLECNTQKDRTVESEFKVSNEFKWAFYISLFGFRYL